MISRASAGTASETPMNAASAATDPFATASPIQAAGGHPRLSRLLIAARPPASCSMAASPSTPAVNENP